MEVKMSDKEETTNENNKVDIKQLSLMELYALYNFIRSTENRPFTMGAGKEAKTLVRNRTNEIETELMLRTFGCNPFTMKLERIEKMIRVEGEMPEKIDLTKFDEKPEDVKRFVVAKNKEGE
jgi:histone acetyltransferase (RNA polymerase elongator complex component)